MTYYQMPKITSLQREVINGTIMGGSSIVKSKGRNCFLSMRGKNGAWIQCKAQEMTNLTPPNPFYSENGKFFRWHSICSPIFNEFYETFYPNGIKTVNMEVLDSFRSVGLAVWFLDSGLIHNKKLKMSLRSFEKREIVVDYFKAIDLNATIVGTKIEMDVESTKRFIRVIGEHIPQFLLN